MDAIESKRMSQPGIDISSCGHGVLGFPYGVLSWFCYVLPIGKDRFECITVYELTRHQHMGPWSWGLRWIDVPFGMLMCLPWKLCGHGVDVPFGDLMGLRAPARMY